MGGVERVRRCLACGELLPADADPRRVFCRAACVARAYRKRVKLIETTARRREVYALFAGFTYEAKVAIVSGAVRIPGVQCPVCGLVVWQGVRRRASARYCSAACRQAAYRARQASHDELPSRLDDATVARDGSSSSLTR